MDIVYVNVDLSSIVINASLRSKRENSLEKERQREREILSLKQSSKKNQPYPLV